MGCLMRLCRESLMLRRLLMVALFTTAAAMPAAFGQPATVKSSAANAPSEEAAIKTDALGRDTPKGTVIGFIRAARAGDAERAAQYLDTRRLPDPVSERVNELRLVLDYGRLEREVEALSSQPEGDLDDDLPPKLERVGTVTGAEAEVEIELERVERKGLTPIWRFTANTLKGVPAVYREIQPAWIEQFLWSPLKEIRYLNTPLWKWLILPLSLGVVLLVARLISRAALALLSPVLFKVSGERARAPLQQIVAPIRLLIASLVMAAWLSITTVPLLTRIDLNRVALVLGVVGLVWFLTRVIDIAMQSIESRLRRRNQAGRITVSHLMASLIKVGILIVGALSLLYHFDVDLTTTLAGLGIGGVAVAFAAQKTLENLFGGIMIISDQPVRVGDFCKADDVMGTVETIGLRSTRIRTLDRTVVSVPNAKMAAMNVENYGTRDMLLFRPTLGLRFETQADQMRYVLAEIRRMFYEHPMVQSEDARIRFVRYGGSSLDLDIFAYVLTTQFDEFLQVQEDLLLRIMDIVEASGTGFAFPSSTTYLARDSGLDKDKTDEAVATVGRWREKRELPFPDFHPSQIAELENRIQYPPADSAVGTRGSPK